MKYSVISVFAILCTSSARAGITCDSIPSCQAAVDAAGYKPVCDSMESCHALRDFEWISMSYYDMVGFCRTSGQRLPTARELALLAQSLGAQGISQVPRPGYDLIRGTNPFGNPDYFYYSHEGFKPQQGRWNLWSSSVVPGIPGDPTPSFRYAAYVLSSYDGSLGVNYLGENSTVGPAVALGQPSPCVSSQ